MITIDNQMIEECFKKPYWIIDILPKQVPANARGQYFKIEEYFLKQPQMDLICHQFSNLLIKLNCYEDISVFHSSDDIQTKESETWTNNPQPECLREWVLSRKQLYVLIQSEDTLIVFNGDDHYMTLYNPNQRLLELISSLANSDGLFVWHPKNNWLL